MKLTRADGGGALLDLASHHIDLARFLLDTEVEVASASVTSTRSEHDGASLRLRLARGASGELRVGFRAPQVDTLELVGERGTIRIDLHAGRVTRRPTRLAPSRELAVLRLHLLARRGLDPSYALALRAFVARVRGEDVELPTLEDGLASLTVVLAAEVSRGLMRILLVTDWTAEAGGIETYLELIATGLRAAGDEVALLTSSAGPAVHADYRAFGTERRAAQAFLQDREPTCGAGRLTRAR